ncbi:MAG: hypothetical protein GF317_18055 [Candidatus Lokiarchaeota archaeon]|nr:hypothetical protein [Candidatus Lokiarchaeota archaeon]MBD3201417.1 hypothetical protein [Candidatus Lokiarchaeota archaeon]
MRRSWKSFVEKLSILVRFLHKDEFNEEFDQEDAEFPSAYLKDEQEMNLFILKETMDSVYCVEELKDVVYEMLIKFVL